MTARQAPPTSVRRLSVPTSPRELDQLPDLTADDIPGPGPTSERILPAPDHVARLPLSPGDALVIILPANVVTLAEAHGLRDHVRRELGRPDLPVLVFPAGTAVSVLSSDHAGDLA